MREIFVHEREKIGQRLKVSFQHLLFKIKKCNIAFVSNI